MDITIKKLHHFESFILDISDIFWYLSVIFVKFVDFMKRLHEGNGNSGGWQNFLRDATSSHHDRSAMDEPRAPHPTRFPLSSISGKRKSYELLYRLFSPLLPAKLVKCEKAFYLSGKMNNLGK